MEGRLRSGLQPLQGAAAHGSLAIPMTRKLGEDGKAIGDGMEDRQPIAGSEGRWRGKIVLLVVVTSATVLWTVEQIHGPTTENVLVQEVLTQVHPVYL